MLSRSDRIGSEHNGHRNPQQGIIPADTILGPGHFRRRLVDNLGLGADDAKSMSIAGGYQY